MLPTLSGYWKHSPLQYGRKILNSKICSNIVNLLRNLINGAEATIEALDMWELINADFNDEYAAIWNMTILGLMAIKCTYLTIRWVISLARRRWASGR